MTRSRGQLASVGDDFRLMACDLRAMSGVLSEIATVWRRASPGRPDLLLGLPLQLQAATRQIARVVDDLAWTDVGQEADAVPVIEQILALERDVADTKAMTCGVGVSPVGDSGLWERLEAAMRQARARANRDRPSQLA
jgi:hypothetical protein